MKLTDQNIELYLFRYKEGLLDATENAEVERALRERPDWQELADLYDPELTLPAGVTMPYADANSLRDGGPKAANLERKPIVLRDEQPRRRLMPLWTAVAAAACLLLFVTTIVKFVGGESPVGGPVTAEVKADTASQPSNSNTAEVKTLDLTVENVAHQVVRHCEPVLLAEADSQSETAIENDEQAVESPALATPSDSSKYDLDEPTLREVNDPMNQEILYANIIVRQPADASDASDASDARRTQIRDIVRRATTIAATRQQRRKAIEENIEDRIESNELITNLMATLE